MIILDTDHLSVLKYARNARFTKLAQRMADSPDQDFVTQRLLLKSSCGGGWQKSIVIQIPRNNFRPTQS